MKNIPNSIGSSLAVSFFTVLFMVTVVTHPAYAGGKSPYESGYDHGCDDADISDPDDRYINQPEKGPSFHTDRFMNGYNAGFSECSGSGNAGGSSSDGESRENLGSRLCNLVDTNRGAATLLALALGYPGLDQAALALCGVMVD